MPRKHCVGAVAQVCREPSAGCDGGTNARARRGRVPERDNDSGGNEFLDEWQGAIEFRSERDQTDAARGGVLEATKFVPIRRADVARRMRAARTIFRADVRPFKMQGWQGAGENSVRRTGAINRGEAV